MLNSVASCVEYWLVKFDVNSGSVLIFNDRDDSASSFESAANARDLASDCAAIYFCYCHNFVSVFSYTISLILYLRAVFRTELGCKYTTIICSNKFLFVNFQIIFCVPHPNLYNIMIMKGIEIKRILSENGVSVAHIARHLGLSQQNLSAALQKDDIRTGLLEDIAGAIGKDVSFFYGVGTSAGSALASGDNSTAVAGNNNRVNTERFVNLLAKKDEQIDRLLSIIEALSNK